MSIARYSKIFCKRMTALRMLRNMSQVELAQRTGMTAPAISQIESGTRLPAFNSIIKIADALDFSIDYLIGRSHKPLSTGPTIERLTRYAEQLPTEDLELLIQLAERLAKKNRQRLDT